MYPKVVERVRRLWPVLILAAALALGPTGAVLAHGFGQRYTLPVPLWLYLYGGAATVVLSFVAVGFFVGRDENLGIDTAESVPHRSSLPAHHYPRLNLLRFRLFRATLGSRPFIALLRVASVALLVLVVVAGLFGDQEPALNFAPTFVWIVWWVGLGYFTALVGNVWPLINPWKVLFEWADALARRLGLEEGLELHEPYPARLGVWPALALYFAFVWIEIVYAGSPSPLNLAMFALAYSLVSWGGMALFGKQTWLRQGDAFGVFFDILGRFAPTEVRVTNADVCEYCSAPCREAARDCVNCYECFADAAPEDRRLNLRPWAVGLLRPEPVSADRLAFVVFMLASVTMDGLFSTNLWSRLQTALYPVLEATGPVGYTLLQTLALVLLPLVFLLLYFGFSHLVRRFGGSRARLGEVASAFVYSLVPISLAYQLAHYYTLLLIQGQGIVALASDPFGWGWDLFGTADYRIDIGVVSAAFAWYSQVALIVAGHVIAVYLAHVIALRLLGDPKRALRSQYPMLALMVLYTVSSLWILSQPIVEETGARPTPVLVSARAAAEVRTAEAPVAAAGTPWR